MISTTLVIGASASAREHAIAGLVGSAPGTRQAVLLEGLPDGPSVLNASPPLQVLRIAGGCLCCSSQMIMQVYLNRLIQQKPQRLFLSLSTTTHLPQLIERLTSDIYATKLVLTEVLNLDIVL